MSNLQALVCTSAIFLASAAVTPAPAQGPIAIDSRFADDLKLD